MESSSSILDFTLKHITYELWVFECVLVCDTMFQTFKHHQALSSVIKGVIKHHHFMRLYDALLCFITLYDAFLCLMMLYDALWHFMTLYDTLWHFMMLHDPCCITLDDVTIELLMFWGFGVRQSEWRTTLVVKSLSRLKITKLSSSSKS